MNKGSRALGKKLGKEGPGSQAELARRLDVTRGAITRWLTGGRLPTLQNRVLLQSLYGIHLLAWDRPVKA